MPIHRSQLIADGAALGSAAGPTRREVIGAALVLPFVGRFRTASAPASDDPDRFEPWIEIHAGHLRANLRAIRARMDGRPVCAVLKNNAYGGGLIEVGRIVDREPAVAAVAVVKLDEAMRLRGAGFQKPVLLMARVPDHQWTDVIAHRITPSLNADVLAAVAAAARRRGVRADVQVDVDTGLGRVGIGYREAPAFIRRVAAEKSLRITGIMSSLTEDVPYDREQVRRFDTVAEDVRDLPTGVKHLVTSNTLFQHPDLRYDWARTGIACWGCYPQQPFRGMGLVDLTPAFALRARVVNVARLAAGDSVGYDRVYLAKTDGFVATIPIGHADGWPRLAAKGASVRIGSRRFRVVSLSASHCVVEVGPDPLVRVGDLATCFDWEAGSRPEDVGEACGASVYDLLMHLSPLLPRRVIPG